MMRYCLFPLVLMCAMPSSPAHTISQEQFYDAQARSRHYRVHRHRVRHRDRIVVYAPIRTSVTPKGLAPSNVGTFDRDQEEVKYQRFDVSTLLTPMDRVIFPEDPSPFKTRITLPDQLDVIGGPRDERSKAMTLTAYAFIIMGILVLGMVSELRKLYDLSQARSVRLSAILKRDPLTIVKLKGFRKSLSDLT